MERIKDADYEPHGAAVILTLYPGDPIFFSYLKLQHIEMLIIYWDITIIGGL